MSALRILSQYVLMLVVVFVTAVHSGDGTKYVVEVLAVIDRPMLEKWMKAPGVGTKERVLAEAKSFFYEVNVIYQSLRLYGLDVEIRLKEVLFTNSSIIPEKRVINKLVWQEEATNNFHAFLRRRKITKYDHAMFLVAHDLRGASAKETGLARTNGACSFQGTSRVEHRLNARTVVTAAHEIGHSLGSSHDSQKNPKCMGGFVMDPSGHTGARKRWYFSPCTARTFKNTLKSKRCLRKTTSLPIVASRLGELVGKHDFCKRCWGQSGHVGSWAVQGDAVCNVLQCSNGKLVMKTNTPDGINCGGGKRCFMGRCV